MRHHRIGNSIEFDKRWRKRRAAAKRARIARRKQR